MPIKETQSSTTTTTAISRSSTKNDDDLIIKIFYHVLPISILHRILNALLLQTQFDPDEYWQTLEPAYCLAFNRDHDRKLLSNNCALTWEWTRRCDSHHSIHDHNYNHNHDCQSFLDEALHGPLRSHAAILPTYLYYLLLQILHLDSTWMVYRGPVILNVILTSIPVDVCVYYIATCCFCCIRPNKKRNFVKQQPTSLLSTAASSSTTTPTWAFLCSITSWFHGYALSRTYANSIETSLLLIGMALLQPSFGFLHSNHITSSTTKTTTTTIREKLAFVLGGISTSIRFTTLAAWIPIGLYLSHQRRRRQQQQQQLQQQQLQQQQQQAKHVLHLAFTLCLPYGLLGILLSCLIDRFFYGFWAIPFLANFQFNVIQHNGSLYGTHPFHWYFTSGLPAISGILFPCFIWQFYNVIIPTIAKWFRDDCKNKCQNTIHAKQDTDKYSNSDSSISFLFIILFSYIIFHSISPHKEFRFIMPILPIICILSGHTIYSFIHSTNISSPKEQEQEDDSTNENDIHNSNITNTLTQQQDPCFSYKKYTMIPATSRGRTRLVILILILSNYPHLYFLSMIHQRAGLDANHAIASLIHDHLNNRISSSNNTTNPNMEKTTTISKTNHSYFSLSSSSSSSSLSFPEFHVHYLMGCHSAPVYSHMHVPSVRIHAWTLDCSPKCRLLEHMNGNHDNDNASNGDHNTRHPTIVCESNKFLSYPTKFVSDCYSLVVNNVTTSNNSHCNNYSDNSVGNDNRNMTCHHNDDHDYDHGTSLVGYGKDDEKRDIPDFLLMFESQLNSNGGTMRKILEEDMKLVEYSKFPHLIRGIRLLNTNTNHGVSAGNSGGSMNLLRYFTSKIDIDMEHLVLYMKTKSDME